MYIFVLSRGIMLMYQRHAHMPFDPSEVSAWGVMSRDAAPESSGQLMGGTESGTDVARRHATSSNSGRWAGWSVTTATDGVPPGLSRWPGQLRNRPILSRGDRPIDLLRPSDQGRGVELIGPAVCTLRVISKRMDYEFISTMQVRAA